MLAIVPGRGGTRRGDPADGSACKGGRRGWGTEATQASPRPLAPNRRWLLSCRLSLATPLDPRVAFRRRPSIRLLLQRRTARDGRHREWARSPSCVDVGRRRRGPASEHVRREPSSGHLVQLMPDQDLAFRRAPVYCHLSCCFPGSVITFASSGSAGSSSGSPAPSSFAASAG